MVERHPDKPGCFTLRNIDDTTWIVVPDGDTQKTVVPSQRLFVRPMSIDFGPGSGPDHIRLGSGGPGRIRTGPSANPVDRMPEMPIPGRKRQRAPLRVGARHQTGDRTGPVLRNRRRRSEGVQVHATIEATPDGTWQLVDAGSANGIWVDGRRVNELAIVSSTTVTLGSASNGSGHRASASRAR